MLDGLVAAMTGSAALRTAAVLVALAAVPAAAADALLGDVDFKNRKCNEAFHHYLSCFAGDNMKRCYAKWGEESCEQEKALAYGDLGVAWAMFSVFNSKDYCPYPMIDKNLIAYQRAFGCKSW